MGRTDESICACFLRYMGVVRCDLAPLQVLRVVRVLCGGREVSCE
jgi:hypothetical protein